MANNHRFNRKAFNRLMHINPMYILVLAAVLGVVCVFSLRANNEHMAQLRSDVYQADRSGGNVQQALDNLQAYVTAHMNTNLDSGTGSVYPPIQLEYTYLRLVKQENQNAYAANAGLYTAAQNYCQQLDPTDFSGHNRVPCIEQYVSAHGSSVPTVPAALYEFDFLSPAWSPDVAGWSLLATVLCLVAAALLFAIQFGKKYLSA
jgi:hypothetical protein